MPMNERCHARGEDRLHILRRVLGSQTYGKRADFRNARATGGAPPGDLEREQQTFGVINRSGVKPQRDGSPLGVFDGIIEQADQHLSQPRGIGDHVAGEFGSFA